ncbi:MAG: hypothetical protein K6G18_15360 [Treponema sp.]|nr:hypothetical protein [Treponema sp.]
MAKDESFPAAVRPEGRGESKKGGADAYVPNRKVKDSMFVDLFGKARRGRISSRSITPCMART